MFKYGIENLDEHLDFFKGKKVGLITNPTGVDQNFRSSIDILFEKTNLTALYSPEHGLRGNLQDAITLDCYKDEETGVTVHSLYGKNRRRPTKEMLDDVDVICYDIQDVGARFYTYIYTLAHMMEAAKEHNKQIVVFDRPNPLGDKVEGNLLNLKYRSFIGYYSIPTRYGLTVGELATLFNEEFGIGCDLKVIKMSGYKRKSTWYDYNLNYILPSPNLPTVESMFIYLATCIFEGTNISEGRGTTKPFSIFGAPWLKNKELITVLNKKLEHIKFRALSYTPIMFKYEGELCAGVECYVTDIHKFNPVYAGMVMVKEIERLHPEFQYNQAYVKNGNRMIDLNTGDDFISGGTLTLEQIKEKFTEDEAKFNKIKEKYHLYE